MKYTLLLLLSAFIFSCSTENPRAQANDVQKTTASGDEQKGKEESAIIEKKRIGKMDMPERKAPVPDAPVSRETTEGPLPGLKNGPVRLEEEDDDEELAEEISQAMDVAALQLHKMFKDGKLLSAQKGKPVHLLLKKDEKGIAEIVVSEIASKPGEMPIQPGAEIKRCILSDQVTFLGETREFWYDTAGNIDFAGPDRVFCTFERPLQADLVLVPLHKKSDIRSYIDIDKKNTLLYIYPVSLSEH